MGAWAKVVALAVGLTILVAPAGSGSADSFTWGYGYARRRETAAPLGQVTALPEAARFGMGVPFVVPLPGRSQSSPVVVGGRFWLWTYWHGGRAGALWTGTLKDGQGGTASAVPLPGTRQGVWTALPGERFDMPADAAVSPDGRWVAFAAGGRLYWWPTSDPSAAAVARITGPSPLAAESTSPVFIPVGPAVARSGWEVCDGNWDGGFACFAVSRDRTVAPYPTAGYQVTWTDAADAGGFAPITSSAAYGGPRGDVYFGVASAADPRVVSLNPRTGAYHMLGSGQVGAPVGAAVAVTGHGVYAADTMGRVYRFSVVSGAMTAKGPSVDGVPTIASPAVGQHAVYALEDGYRRLAVLARGSLRPLAPAAVLAGAASAVTVVPVGGGAPSQLVYAQEGGGVDLAVRDSRLGMVALGSWPGAPEGRGYRWTAAVVVGQSVLLWSDGAAQAWRGRAAEARSPAGLVGRGGLQVYALVPRLSAWVAPGVVTANGAATTLWVLTAVGAQPTATAGGYSLDLRPGGGGVVCPIWIRQRVGPSYGAFPWGPAGGSGPPGGCGPFSGSLAVLDRLAAAASLRPHPHYSGLTPAQWQGAGVGYEVWRAPVPAGVGAGLLPIDIQARLLGGGAARTVVWLRTACAPGWLPVVDGRCAVVGPSGASQVEAGCASGGIPGILCTSFGPWLTDGRDVGCYGSWWHWVRRVPASGCVTAEGPRQGTRG